MREVTPQPPSIQKGTEAPKTSPPTAILTTVPPRTSAVAPRRILSVGELTRQIKGTLEAGFSWVCVRGEVSGFRGPNPRGHLYFGLKDREACLDAKIWATAAQRLKFSLRDGLEVIAEGSIDLYEPQGRYSLVVQRIEPAGEGALALAFQQLKERLSAEGLFGERRIRPVRAIPFLPRRIGVVTSRSGAALRDFLRVLHQRNPHLSVLLCDARVQGDGATPELVLAIRRLARTDVDVIVVTRGGGSIEDLWPFNEERVARAIHLCPVPVVSAIGHEIDFTIADFVADYRAPTPSAAAEKLAPVLKDLELGLLTAQGRLRHAASRQVLVARDRLMRLGRRLSDPHRMLSKKQTQLADEGDRLIRAIQLRARLSRETLRKLKDRLDRHRPQAKLKQNHEIIRRLDARMREAMSARRANRRNSLEKLKVGLRRRSPRDRIRMENRKLSEMNSWMATLIRRQLAHDHSHFRQLGARIETLSPMKVMGRGYALVFDQDGHVVRGAEQVQVGADVAIRFAPVGAERLSDCDQVDARVTAAKRRS